jgi:hypothetical protein
MMNLLIRFNADDTHAAVSATIAKSAYGGAHLLRPGESYRGVPYEVWRTYVDQGVDALALQHWVKNLPPPPAAAPSDARRGLIPRPATLLQAILQGILLFWFPYAILTALAREIDQPGPEFNLGRFTDVLTTKLLVAIVVLGPMTGLSIWHKRDRARRTG